jgi:hypothetical protein
MMWRRVLAVVVAGLLILGPLSGALAMKPPVKGKGNPVKWGDPGIVGPEFGDPDWPAFSREREEGQRTAVKFGDPGTLGETASSSPSRSVTAIGRERWWSSLLFELGLQVHTIVIWRR